MADTATTPSVTSNATNATQTSNLTPFQQAQGGAKAFQFADQSGINATGQAMPAPSASTTTISNSNKMGQVHGIVSTTDSLSKTGITTDANGNATYANGTIASQPDTAPAPNPNPTPNSLTTTTGGYVGDLYYAPGSTLPKDSNGNPVATTPTSPTDDHILSSLNTQKAQADSLTASIIDSIQAQYTQLIEAQKRTNASQEAGVQTSLLMGGVTGQGSSAQFAPISSAGIMQSQISYGLSQIADLTSKENMAIIQAKQAGQAADFQLMDKMNTQISKIRDDKVAAATKLNDTIAVQNQKLADEKIQATKDQAVSSLYKQGITDPVTLMSKLKEQGITMTADAVANTIKAINPNSTEIANIASEAAKFGASKETIAKISQSRTLNDAIVAAAGHLQDPTSTAGQYAAYLATPLPKGQSYVSAGDFIAAQKYKEALATAKADAATAYSKAYSTKLGQNAADAQFEGSSKGQDKLEQEYRQTLLKELSNRSGGLGMQDAKVNQAIHLKALFEQYKTTDSKGKTVYNIPSAQYSEIAMGLANLVSAGNTVSDSARDSILQKTASGDFSGAITYITGTPQTSNTQEVFKNLVDSVDRQGKTAEQLRDQDVRFLHGLAPTGLSQDRIDALEKNSLPSYSNPQNNYSAAQTAQEITGKIAEFRNKSGANAAIIDQLHQTLPNASNVDIAIKLGIIPDPNKK